MKISFEKIYAVAFCLLICLSLTGCVTTGNGLDEAFVVKKGMLAEELAAGLGEPDEIVPYAGEVEGVELWVYRRERTDTKLVSTDMKEIPYVDPVTGHQGTQLQNIMSPEITISETKTIFLVAEGIVEAWKVEQDDKSYR